MKSCPGCPQNVTAPLRDGAGRAAHGGSALRAGRAGRGAHAQPAPRCVWAAAGRERSGRSRGPAAGMGQRSVPLPVLLPVLVLWQLGGAQAQGESAAARCLVSRPGGAGGEGALGAAGAARSSRGAAAGRRGRDGDRHGDGYRHRGRALLPAPVPAVSEGALGACPGGRGGGRKEMALGRWWNHEGLGGCGRV